MTTNSQPLAPEEILDGLIDYIATTNGGIDREGALKALDAHYRILYDAKFEAVVGKNEEEYPDLHAQIRNRLRDQARKRWYGGRDDT